ncbi:hypothetical protein DVH24_005952 [Malus domestica]|uniref:Serine-rich protein n=1 Tax=Malus domestica TaxID=3750 RepID=A0A498IKI3_MALDO|nr:hypothetical protein DVH24_005952 [Malus domestica]
MKRQEEGVSTIGPIINDIRRLLLLSFTKVRASHVQREANQLLVSGLLLLPTPPEPPLLQSPYPQPPPSPISVRSASSSPSSSVRFSINHRSISHNHYANRSIAISKITKPISMPKKTCMCSPTSHRGSFRCSLHKNQGGSQNTRSFPSNRLNIRRSAMTNSLWSRRQVGEVSLDHPDSAFRSLAAAESWVSIELPWRPAPLENRRNGGCGSAKLAGQRRRV